jgi:hypothetical protein
MAQTKFGLNQVSNTTPRWANIILLLTITLTTVAAFVVASDPGIADAVKVRIGVYLKGFDMLIAGVSRLFGIELPTESKQK